MSLSVEKQIQHSLTACNKNSPSLQQLFGLDGVNVHGDFQRTLAAAPRAGLRRLEAALQENRVLRRAYIADGSRGCLVFHLFGVTNRQELVDLALPSVETGFAIYRTIQAWDDDRLSGEVVEHFLRQELAARESSPVSCSAIRKECVSA